ncbi:MAG: ABC transporter permease, partial [Chthoniobacterales bacterium]
PRRYHPVLPNYLRFFHWQVMRYAARHRLLALLNILSVALGVAVYLAIQIANQSANRAFAATIDVVAGKADLQITRPGRGLPEEIFPAVAQSQGIAAATPLVRGVVSLPDLPGEYLQILGLDIFTNHAFRTFELNDFAAGEFDLQKWLASPETVAVTADFAEKHGLKPGDTLRAQLDGADRLLHVGFVIRTKDSLALDEHFAAMDIGWAQELFGQRGTLNSIQLRLTDPRQIEAARKSLQAIVPPDASIATPAQRGAQVANLLGGFELNLTAMSLVSLLVGMFLIYNTVSASVVRRRHEIGILRSLGGSRNEIRALFLGEALALGAGGVLLGLLGGVLLAQRLVAPVSETISSLYVLLSVKHVAVTPGSVCSAAALGFFSVLVAAWLPANAAAKMDPVRALRAGSMIEQSRNLSPAWLWLGLLSLLLAAGLSGLALVSGPPWLGFGAAFFVLAGFSLLVPRLVLAASASAAMFFRVSRVGPLEARLAAANVSRALVRNAVTIAALAAAVAMAIGVSVMVFSFRRTIESWITETMVADLFLAPASNEIVGPSSFFPAAAIQFLRAHPAVAEIDTYRDAALKMDGKTIAVAVVQGSERRRLNFLRGNGTAISHRFATEECVLVSESFARRHHVADGQEMELLTPEGPHRFPIAGTFYDYTRDQGVVFMNAKTFMHYWRDERVNSVAVYLRPGASVAALTTEFRAKFSTTGQFIVWSNRELRTRVFEIFDQTFAVTYVLRTIAV